MIFFFIFAALRWQLIALPAPPEEGNTRQRAPPHESSRPLGIRLNSDTEGLDVGIE